MHYDVTIITVRPGTHLEALARLKETFQPSLGGNYESLFDRTRNSGDFK